MFGRFRGKTAMPKKTQTDRLVDAVADRVGALTERGYNWPRQAKRKLA
jgi:hypothetical protein